MGYYGNQMQIVSAKNRICFKKLFFITINCGSLKISAYQKDKLPWAPLWPSELLDSLSGLLGLPQRDRCSKVAIASTISNFNIIAKSWEILIYFEIPLYWHPLWQEYARSQLKNIFSGRLLKNMAILYYPILGVWEHLRHTKFIVVKSRKNSDYLQLGNSVESLSIAL